MAEGDTIHRLARNVSDAILGGRVSRLWLRDRGEVAALRGAEVREVSALGKHLLVAFRGDTEWVLHTHLGMPGRWRRAGAGAAWPQSETPAVDLSLRDRPVRWLCTKPARCELFPRFVLRDHPELRSLGPDLLASPIPYDVIVRRARASRAATLAELLLDQRVACGLGNVYKSELLFLHRCAPRSGVADAPDDLVEALFRRGAALLAANLGPGRRRTRGLDSADPREPRFWVYDRGGRPCLRCATPVRVDRVGAQARVTYWCPQCQSVPQRLPSSTMDGGASDGREAPQAPRFR